MRTWTFLEFEYWYDQANMERVATQKDFDQAVKTGPTYDGLPNLLDTENAAVAYKIYLERIHD